jgi:acyl-homoserine-lactone acylase
MRTAPSRSLSKPRQLSVARALQTALPACAAACATLVLLSACGSSGDPSYEYDAQIRRTSYGIPHITAADSKGLGYGAGYAFAQDNFCVLADKVVQVNGERAKHFGADALATMGSSPVPSIRSIDSDFFYKLQYDKTTMAALWASATQETKDMAAGYAEGVNRWLRETTAANLPTECRSGSWVRPITPLDLYLWWSSITTISGSQGFAQAIADGHQQPAVASATPRERATRLANAKAERHAPRPVPMPAHEMLASAGRAMAQEASLSASGSNGWAFGKDTTADGKGMLLTNPHWPWGGMAKFYQMHLTIPGQVNVMGVAYPGSPMVLVGFNEKVGWTHTVSTGPRFTIREMTLDAASPLRYMLDGVSKPMTARPITVEVKDLPAVTRTYHTTEFGPLLRNTALGLSWTTTRAFAFNDINLLNNRMVEQWMGLARARSSEEARQSLGTILGAPLINTLITDDTGDAVYVDYSLKPFVEDAKLASCALAGVGQTLTAQGRPTLDGSRSSCNPDSDPSARQSGVLPMAKLPFLRRTDYVANANNSYWLTNPAAPITGLPSINGPAAADIGLRPRMNLIMIADRLGGRDGLPGNKVTPESIKGMLIGTAAVPSAGNRSIAADLMMPAVTTLCAAGTSVTMADATVQDISGACSTLAAWDRRYNAESVGTHVFREFFTAASAIGATLWATPFSATDPVNTPRDPNLANATVSLRLRQALGTAVRNLQARGIPLNRPWGELFYTAARGANIPAGGGTSAEGVANQMNGGALSATGYNNVTSGSSYVSAMAFGANGPEVDAVLIPGQSVNSASPYYYDQMQNLWARRQWLRLPFTEAQIAADPNVTTTRLFQ